MRSMHGLETSFEMTEAGVIIQLDIASWTKKISLIAAIVSEELLRFG